MGLPAFIAASVALAILLLATLFSFQTLRSHVTSVLHLISNLAQGHYARRTDPSIRGVAGDLARASNALAADLEVRAAQAQQDSDHLVSLLAMLDHTNEIAIATDNLDVIRLANPAAARMLERPLDALLGKHIETVIHHPDLRTLYRNAFSSSSPVSAQITLQIPGRALHLEATAATIYANAHYRGTLLVLRDVTEIARTLQMKTDFATNASHELRTPLASIRAAVETMKDAGLEDLETSRRCTNIINNHVLRLQLMVQDLLDLSRAEDSRVLVRTDTIDLLLVCEALAGSYTNQLAEKNLLLHLDLAPDALTMKGDERLLTLILKNLIDNAIKYTPNGSVTIRSQRVPAPGRETLAAATLQASSGTVIAAAAPAAPAAVTAADHLVLEVQDTGIGIPPEDQERVFERFYTVNRSRGGSDRGTGLGLSIVKHAVSAMHGTVALSSQAHQGTTVRCIFPA